MSPASRGFRHLHRAPAGKEGRVPPGQYVTAGFPVLSAGPTPHTPPEDGRSPSPGRADHQVVDLGRDPGAADRDRHHRHPLRHPLVQARHRVAGRVRGHAAGPGRARRPVRAGVLRRRLHDEPAAADIMGGQAWLAFGYDGSPLSRARRPGPAAGAAPVLLEERQVGQGPGAARRGRARLLGDLRLSHVRGPMAGTAVRGRLTWQIATVSAITRETARAVTIALEVPAGPATGPGSTWTSGSPPRTVTGRSARTRSPRRPASRWRSPSSGWTTARSRPTSPRSCGPATNSSCAAHRGVLRLGGRGRRPAAARAAARAWCRSGRSCGTGSAPAPPPRPACCTRLARSPT